MLLLFKTRVLFLIKLCNFLQQSKTLIYLHIIFESQMAMTVRKGIKNLKHLNIEYTIFNKNINTRTIRILTHFEQ